ncbi:glutathione S-transferase family protein [Hoeflea sp. YIM 152468]|uniref:glutathione S-transferase family protein n=1 Tax=Hoeflea sp. YIM 152468 TaxID=3031759 RepID=UPI0023D9D8BB|nr:glutathione S-transferase family protein [Hoeflea sp. YIM 152468]MDF1608497.1 glutathione S-transferase family protein [Hoeflea sp. YIM 152468]
MLTVWGRATSSNVQAVMWTIAELGLDFERHDVGHAHGGNKTADYLAMNPNGLVPTVRDGDGAPMWESAAIVRYLAARYGDAAFWPRDPAVRVQLDMWAEWIKTSFVPVFTGQIFRPLMALAGSTPMQPGQVQAATDALKPLALRLDKRLGDGPYLGGAELSFADMIAGHLLYRYCTLDFDRAVTPSLDAYYARLSARPHYRDHVMVSYESLRTRP